MSESVRREDKFSGDLTPPTAVPAGGATSSTARIVASLGDSGIPEVALRAYRGAELALATGDPSCGVTWSLLAAIGRVESNHGRFGGVRQRATGSSEAAWPKCRSEAPPVSGGPIQRQP
jgi:hypothetical protein